MIAKASWEFYTMTSHSFHEASMTLRLILCDMSEDTLRAILRFGVRLKRSEFILRVFHKFPISLLYGKHVVRSFLPNGVFLPCDHRLGFSGLSSVTLFRRTQADTGGTVRP